MISSSRRRAHAWYSARIALQTSETVDLEIAAWSPSVSARVACTSRTDSPRTNAAITSVSRALVFVTCLPNNRDANAAVVPRSFGRSNVTGPVVVLTVTGRYPLREPSLASGQAAVALVAFAAEELGDLSLQGRLHQQLGAEAGDFFKDLRQLPILGKQGVDLGADTVGG